MKTCFNKSNQEGIALLLTIVVLAAILGLAVSVSTVVMRVIQSNRSIGVSEIAFYAAEAAAELVVYDIEVNGKRLDIIDVVDEPLDTISGATWSSGVSVQTTVPSICSSSKPKVVCGDSSTVTSANPLSVTLQDGQTFQFDFDLIGAVYPNTVQISWSGGGTRVDIMDGSDLSAETSSPVTFPPTGTINPNDGDRFRIVNSSGSEITYTITPSSGQALPLGIKITTKGRFSESERIVELTRPSWIIY